MFRSLRNRLGLTPRALIHALTTYPRFIGRIKPALLAASEREAQAIFRGLEACIEVAWLRPPIARRILVVAPHPDDETLGPGGLILAHRGAAEIHEVVVFNGEGGGQLPGSRWRDAANYKAALAARRRDEVEAAARRLGIKSVTYLGLVDNGPIEPFVYQSLRAAVEHFKPGVVLLPWYLDGQRDHRAANALWAESCSDIDCMIVAYEVWGMLPANSVLDITAALAEKVEISRLFVSQDRGNDYPGYIEALARVRAFQQNLEPARAVEAYFSLPNHDYCALVRSLYGQRDKPTECGRELHLDEIWS